MHRKVILFVLALCVNLAAQSPKMELSYYPAPSAHNSTTNTLVSSSPLQYFVLEAGWGSIDQGTGPSGYTWSTIETSINDYLTTYSASVCAGRCIQLIFAPANDTTPNSSSYTPTYVMTNAANTVCECGSYAGSGNIAGGSGCQTGSASGDGGTASPVPFSPPFQTAYTTFIANAVAHILQQSYATHLVSITFGGQRGGELAPTCATQVNTFFSLTNATLTTSMQGAIGSFNNSFRNAMGISTVPGSSPSGILLFNGITCINITQPSTGDYCAYSDAMAATHAKYNIGLRMTGGRATDLTNYAGNAPTFGDWSVLFTQYALPVDIQDATQSDPSGGTCSVGQASKVGNLVPLITFIMQHRGKATRFIFESISTDLNGAYTGGTNSCWPSACFTGSCPYVPYDTSFRAALLGQPYGTTVISGKAKISGSALIQ